MTNNNYYVTSPQKPEKCHMCGGEATLILVSVEEEKETGYIDEVPLCEDCAQKRGV